METPLTPMPEHIRQLDEQVRQTHAYKQNKSELDELKDGQANMMLEMQKHEEENARQFDKGARRMDGIEGKVDKLTEMIQSEGKKRDEQHGAIMKHITDNEIMKLKGELDKRDEQMKKTDNRIWDVLKIIIGIFIVAGLGYLGVK